MKRIIHCFLTLTALTFAVNWGSFAKTSSAKKNIWYKGLFFKDESLNFESIRALGEAYFQGSDIGETVYTLKQVNSKDIDSWYKSWISTADRIYELGRGYERDRHFVSAKKAYFRASNYYRAASFYLDAPDKRDLSTELLAKSVESFLRAIKYQPDIEKISIPYEDKVLPGYFLKSKKSKAPLLIAFSGFDGTKEEVYFDVGVAALERGYNVVLFDGPGQGEALRTEKLYFRYDWEKVVAPVIDYSLRNLSFDKSRIAIMGRSMGGYLSPRAAAYDKRVDACIANGGVYDFAGNVFKNFPPEFLKLMKDDPDKFNTELLDYAKTNTELSWFLDNGMWSFGVNSPAKLLDQMKLYTMADCVKKIECPTLIIKSTNDMFMEGQPEKLYDALDCPKTLLVFDELSTGEAHCQEGANAISTEKIFNWLDKTFDFYPKID